MNFTQDLIAHVLKKIKSTTKISFQGTDLDFTPPFTRLPFAQAIRNYTQIDIDTISTEEEFKSAVKKQGIKLDITGAVGLGALFDSLYKQYVRPKSFSHVYHRLPFFHDRPRPKKMMKPEKIAHSTPFLCTELLKA